MKTTLKTLALLAALTLTLAGCGTSGSPNPTAPAESAASSAPEIATGEVTILIAAASSLEDAYRDELVPLFQKDHPDIKVEGTYDSSGKLQTQIEEGLDADVFMSAANKQMSALEYASLVDAGSIVELLENRIVLIAPADSATAISSFAGIVDASTIALGDPASVPVGQYAKEALISLGLYDAILPKASLGANVTEVLSWVAEGSADVGIVYATDAATTGKVKIVAEAPEGSLAQKVVYPVGIVSASTKKDAAKLFVKFLSSPEALAIFEAYGFTANVNKV